MTIIYMYENYKVTPCMMQSWLKNHIEQVQTNSEAVSWSKLKHDRTIQYAMRKGERKTCKQVSPMMFVTTLSVAV